MLPRSTLNTITGECVKKGYVMTEHISGCRREAEVNNKGAIALYRRLGYDPLNYLQFIKEPRE